MELKDLIELLYTAERRFTSIQVTWRYHYHVQSMEIAQQRWINMNAEGSVAFLTETRKSNQSIEVDQREPILVKKRIWWQKPACWRQDQTGNSSNDSINISCDGQRWLYSSESNILFTNVPTEERWSHAGLRVETISGTSDTSDLIRDVPLLDPSFLLVTHELEPVSETLYAGRPTIEVRATYQKREDTLHEAFFWATADEYRLLVDQEYGILLRYAALIDEIEYAVSSVEEVIFDQPIPPEIFVFSPPDVT
jgi:hypothetical protein